MPKAYRPILVPSGVEVKADTDKVSISGKLGAIVIPLPRSTTVNVENGQVNVDMRAGGHRALVGTTRAHVLNAFTGVLQGYQKTLELRGMGYRVTKTKDGIQITCGYSHPVDIAPPTGITLDVAQVSNPDETKEQMFEITIKGIERQAVGQIAAEIRDIKPPDNYRGKGFRYRGEYVRKKAGKRAAGTQA